MVYMLIVSALYGARSQELHSSRHMCCDDVTIKVIWFDYTVPYPDTKSNKRGLFHEIQQFCSIQPQLW